jgi:spore germination protein YaaH
VKNLAKIIVAIGSYGYDWNITTNAVAENRSFDTILTLAKNVNATIRTDPKSKNNMFAYRSVDGSIHEVWFSDAASMLNQYLSIKKRQTQGVAFWQIGLSDPGIWNFASTNLVEQFNPRSLANLPNIHSTSFT